MSANYRHSSASDERVRSACAWLMQLQGDNVAEADIIDWATWCAADPDNLRAFDDICDFYTALQALKAPDRKPFLPLAQIHSNRPVHTAASHIFAGAATRRWCIVAAGIVAGTLLVGFLCWWQLGSTAMWLRDYQVAHGSQEAFVLADRSQVTLASASEVRSYFTADRRYLELRAGEAYFEVKHDPARPFVVRAGSLTVRALGTKFNVRRSTDCTVLVVTDGTVDVTTEETPGMRAPPDALASTAAATTSVRVHAGQQAVRLSSQRGLSVSNVNSEAAIAWRAGRLVYIMEPLSSVVEDVNRYTSRPIVIDDTRLRNLVFTGTVFRDQADNWAVTLAGAFPIRVRTDADGAVRLEPRTDGEHHDFR